MRSKARIFLNSKDAEVASTKDQTCTFYFNNLDLEPSSDEVMYARLSYFSIKKTGFNGGAISTILFTINKQTFNNYAASGNTELRISETNILGVVGVGSSLNTYNNTFQNEYIRVANNTFVGELTINLQDQDGDLLPDAYSDLWEAVIDIYTKPQSCSCE